MYPTNNNNNNYFDARSSPNAGPSNIHERDPQPGRNRSKTLTTIHSAVSQTTLTNNNSTPPTPNPANDTASSRLPTATVPQRTIQRKVRTVPPSAIREPPTPPLEGGPTFDDSVLRPPRRPKRARRYRHYLSSSDGSSCASDEDSDDDDETPWWTFTQRGMNKLRSVYPSRSGTHDVNDVVTEPESGREGGYTEWRNRRRSRRSSAVPPARQDSGDQTPKSSAARLFDARHFRSHRASRHQSMDNGGGHSTDTGRNKSTPMLDRLHTAMAPRVTRSNSVPLSPRSQSPVKADGSFTTDGRPLVRTSSPEGMERLSGDFTDSMPVSPLAKRPRVKRFLTAPIRRHSLDGTENYTDSEATMLASPRLRARQRLFGLDTSGLSGGRGAEEGTGTPASANSASRMRRLNAQHLKIRIPPEMKQHLKQGFHAGPWQDALRYGTLDSDDMHDSYFESRQSHRNSDPLAGFSNGPKMRAASLDGHAGALYSGVPPTPASTKSSNGRSLPMNGQSVPASDAYETPDRLRKEDREERKRRKKYKRYQPQTMQPPTPGVLPLPMLAPGEKKVLSRENWGTANNGLPPPDPENNPFDRLNPFDRIDEERSFSSPHDVILEKQHSRSWAPWWLGCCRRRRAHAPVDDLDWRKKMRRMLFLDARITIYIRLVNLGMAATLLGLAITIRLMLIDLDIDGVIGPSTTLIIAYACLTIVHALMAIYKEYFGRPIGLWGLRSKMLWVCLDLLFIALWSSGATLAINDYINTPLDCTPMMPWWTSGSAYYNYQYSFHPQRLTARASTNNRDLQITDELRASPKVAHICQRQIGCFTVAILALLLYCGNMILSLFRIFETVRRTATAHRSISMS